MSKIEKFIPPHRLNIAVLFLVFNRLDTTKQVFEAIRQAKPRRLYIAADGARESRKHEVEKVNAVREYILSNIDWECEVQTLFRESNMGCKMAVSDAITWFFSHEQMGIILEDDCFPSQSFFWFCEELLERYKDDMRVWHIAGNNFNFSSQSSYDYSFSSYAQVWGWASWENRWNFYDKNLLDFFNRLPKRKNIVNKLNISNLEAILLKHKFYNAANGQIDTWDYQWHATVIKNNGLCIFPTKNLISNIGDGEDATHTKKDKERTHLKTFELIFPLKNPNNFLIDNDMEEWNKTKMGVKISFFRSIKSFMKRILKK